MNIAEMNKEQKQILILSVGGAIAVVMLAMNLVVNPAKKKAAAAEKTIEELGGNVRNGETFMRRDPRVKNELETNSKAILEIYKTQLPPEVGRYGWALDNIIGVAEKASVQVSVKESRGERFIPAKTGDKGSVDTLPMWVPYNVNVDLFTSFSKLKTFLTLLEAEYPYSSVAIMEISARKEDNDNHFIRLLIEWPVFRFEKDLEQIQQFANGIQ